MALYDDFDAPYGIERVYHWPGGALSVRIYGARCIDCDRPLRQCSCAHVLRCSCGIPNAACVCA